MLADLPPSSRNTFFTVSDALAMMRRPVAVDPVKVIMSTRASVVSTSPTMWSDDATTLTTPAGMSVSSAMNRPRKVADHGVSGAGLSTTVFPAARAGTELGQVQVEGEVPRRDGPDHADGLAADQPTLGLAEDLAHGQPVLVLVPVGLRRPVGEVVDGAVHLHDVGQHHGAAHLGHHDGAQLLLVGLEGGVELFQTRPPEGVVRGPRRLVEGAARRGDGLRHVGRGAVGGVPERLLGGGVDVGEARSAARLH